MDNIGMIIGQILGGLAVVCGFLTYQMRTQKQLLIVNTVTCTLFVVHYILLGAISGCALNALAIIRNFVYAYRNEKKNESPLIPIVFTAAMLIVGILTWHAWYSVLMAVALPLVTWSMSYKDPQTARKYLLVASPMVLIYDVFVLSIGGIVYESVATTSAVIGIIRFHKNKTEV